VEDVVGAEGEVREAVETGSSEAGGGAGKALGEQGCYVEDSGLKGWHDVTVACGRAASRDKVSWA
jgi:hypothetical protein